MKKGIVLFGACLLLGACQMVGTNTPETQVTQQKLTLKEVQAKQLEVVKEIKSLAFDMGMVVNIVTGEKSQTVMDMSTSVDVIVKPVTMKMQMRTQGQNLDMYYVDNTYYIKVADSWKKAKLDVQSQVDSFEKQFQAAAELDLQNATMEETDKHYVIRQELTDKVLIEEYVKKTAASLGNQDSLEAFVQQGATIDKIATTHTVDKKTFYLESSVSKLDMTFPQGGQDNKAVVNVSINYRDVNNVKPIELPAEAQNASE